MKHFIQTNLHHLVTGLATFLVDAGLINNANSESFTLAAVAALTIIITRSLLILASKLDLKSIGLWISSTFSCVYVGLLSMAAVGGLLPSCLNPDTGLRELPKLPEGITGSFIYHS